MPFYNPAERPAKELFPGALYAHLLGREDADVVVGTLSRLSRAPAQPSA